MGYYMRFICTAEPPPIDAIVGGLKATDPSYDIRTGGDFVLGTPSYADVVNHAGEDWSRRRSPSCSMHWTRSTPMNLPSTRSARPSRRHEPSLPCECSGRIEPRKATLPRLDSLWTWPYQPRRSAQNIWAGGPPLGMG